MVTKPWTVIAYIVADDDRKPVLNPFASDELAAMKQAAIDEDIDLAAYVDFTGPGIESQRCFVAGRREDPSACRNAVEKNSATMSSLKDFLGFANERMNPDSRIAMILWGHGAGPAGFFLDPNPEPQKSLALPEICEAFRSLPSQIEVMFFRDCWTANLELVYPFDGMVRHVIACQGLVPIPGVWPFRKLFQALKQTPDSPQPQHIGQLLAPLDEHYQSAINRGVPPLSEVRFAALNVANSRDTLASALGALVSALETLTGTDRLGSRAVMEHAKGGDAALVDVMTMCEGLATFPSPVGKAAVDLHAAATQVFIEQTNGTPGIPGNSLKGLSLFRSPAARVTDSNFIESIVYDSYKGLPLCQATRWHEIAYETLFE